MIPPHLNRLRLEPRLVSLPAMGSPASYLVVHACQCMCPVVCLAVCLAVSYVQTGLCSVAVQVAVQASLLQVLLACADGFYFASMCVPFWFSCSWFTTCHRIRDTRGEIGLAGMWHDIMHTRQIRALHETSTAVHAHCSCVRRSHIRAMLFRCPDTRCILLNDRIHCTSRQASFTSTVSFRYALCFESLQDPSQEQIANQANSPSTSACCWIEGKHESHTSDMCTGVLILTCLCRVGCR